MALFASRLVFLVAAITVGLFTISIVSYFGVTQVQQIQNQVISSKMNEVQVLSTRTEIRLNDTASILRITGHSEAVTRIYPEMIDRSVHGVPLNVDAEKRGAARMILDSHAMFDYMFFILGNGDVYMVEPYNQQLSLTGDNFAFRDYYQGAISTGDAYLSDRYISASLGRPSAVIAYPVYSEDGTLTGLWNGALNFDLINQALSELDPGENGRFVYVDKNGLKLAESDAKALLEDESFAGYDFFGKAASGESGWTTEMMDGTEMLVAYYPIRALSNTWIALSIEPQSDAFAAINGAYIQLAILIASISIITAVFAFFALRAFGDLKKASAKLGTLNESLAQRQGELEVKNDELIKVETAKDEFIAMISHELKTPLVPIKGYSEMLAKEGLLGSTNEKQKKAVNSILKNTQRLEMLIQDILDVYKLDMGRMRFSMSSVPVSDLVNQTINDLNSLTMEKKIELQGEVTASGSLLCDPNRITQVFANLVKNSVDFVPDSGGKIVIKAADEGEDVVFSVEDNGSGIAPDKAGNLFQKFYQIDTSATRKHGGTGLGLSICRGIIEAHRGKIWIDKTYTQGAAIRFKIPRGSAES